MKDPEIELNKEVIHLRRKERSTKESRRQKFNEVIKYIDTVFEMSPADLRAEIKAKFPLVNFTADDPNTEKTIQKWLIKSEIIDKMEERY